jgi:hypothetical protein
MQSTKRGESSILATAACHPLIGRSMHVALQRRGRADVAVLAFARTAVRIGRWVTLTACGDDPPGETHDGPALKSGYAVIAPRQNLI